MTNNFLQYNQLQDHIIQEIFQITDSCTHPFLFSSYGPLFDFCKEGRNKNRYYCGDLVASEFLTPFA